MTDMLEWMRLVTVLLRILLLWNVALTAVLAWVWFFRKP